MDEDARRLSANTFILSEFLEQKAPISAAELRRKALCRSTATMITSWASAMKTTCCEGSGLDFEILNSGCCGMAGSFGFEAGHYDSRSPSASAFSCLRPDADATTLIVADGSVAASRSPA